MVMEMEEDTPSLRSYLAHLCVCAALLPQAETSEPTASAALDATPLAETLACVRAAPRETIATPRPRSGTGLFSALRQAIGKDITRISMPVHFNEPTSFTQRLLEDLEYAYLLDQAAACEDPMRRLALVAVFANAMYASSATGLRIYKAFNPLLGETYELVRPSAGYRVVCEQVSHHPPITAMHAESNKGWTYRQHYSADVKFRGTLKLTPDGVAVIEFPNGDRFSYVKPTVIVHNVLLGKLWVEQDGVVTVTNHRTGAKCHLTWQTYNNVGCRYMDLSGPVMDADGKVHYTLHGRWDKGMVILPGEQDPAKLVSGEAILAEPKSQVLWHANEVPPDSKAKYGMTTFAMGLNEPMENICPTDSRLRPDLRLLENGDFPAASADKHRLEEKQRAARRDRTEEWEPRWFKKVDDAQLGRELWVYKGGYWDAKASHLFEKEPQRFPDIY